MRVLKDDFDSGRMAGNEDWETLARNVRALERLSLLGGPYVLEGCGITSSSAPSYTYAAGTVVLDGELHEIAGFTANLSGDKGIRRATPAIAYQRPFTGLAQLKDAAMDRKTELVDANASPVGRQMLLLSIQNGTPRLRTLQDALKDATYAVGHVALVAQLTDFNIVSGKGSGEWDGWRLMIGNQPGGLNMRSKGVIGAGGAFSVGDSWGAPLAAGDAHIALGFAQYVGFQSYWKNA